MILDAFAGPGGWDVGAQAHDLHPIGLEIDAAAVATRYAAGHATWQQSVPAVTDTPGSVKITTTEAAILQGFDPAYPWQGSRSKQFEQIGNAVCPPVAAAVLRCVL